VPSCIGEEEESCLVCLVKGTGARQGMIEMVQHHHVSGRVHRDGGRGVEARVGYRSVLLSAARVVAGEDGSGAERYRAGKLPQCAARARRLCHRVPHTRLELLVDYIKHVRC